MAHLPGKLCALAETMVSKLVLGFPFRRCFDKVSHAFMKLNICCLTGRKATSFRARLASSLWPVGAESLVPGTCVSTELQAATRTDVLPSHAGFTKS